MNGKELSAIGKQIMEAAGWQRIWCGNAPRRFQTPAMRGMSDNIYARDGVLLFIEDKGAGDKMCPEQAQFCDVIRNEVKNLNVLYLVAESVEDYEKYVNIRRVNR